MARIRTVKPEFFRHEKLQELGPLSMLIFEGLWTQCDKAGRFPWKPRTLKLDILPFITFDMEKELDKLAEAFFVIKYEADKEFFGVIPTFLEHQRISGKECQEPAKYPDPPAAKPKKGRKLQGEEKGSTGEAPGKQPGRDGDGLESQEGKGKGREEEREKEGKGSPDFPSGSDAWFSDPLFLKAWDGWEEMRKHDKPKLTDHARELNFTELRNLAGADCSKAISIINKSVASGWKGFFPLKGNEHGNGTGTGRKDHGKNQREFPEALAL